MAKFVKLDVTIFDLDRFMLFAVSVKELSLLLTKTHKTYSCIPICQFTFEVCTGDTDAITPLIVAF